MKKNFIGLVILLLVSGCANWSTADYKQDNNVPKANISKVSKKDPASIIISEEDIKQKYQTLGDISVTVNKTTLFHEDPTPEIVNQKLKEKAAEIGADAVIFVRHGTVGVSVMSWGSLEGKGRAVKFTN